MSLIRAALLALLLAARWAAAAVEIVDDSGQRVRLARPPQRIVALAPHVTELVHAVGAGDALVGVDSASDFPSTVKALPRIGDYSRIDVERVLALQPDLVIGWASGNRAADIHRLRQLGIPVLLTDAHRLGDVARLLRVVGMATGQCQRAATAAADFEAGLAALRARYRAARPRRVFYEVWERPLMTVGGRHWISDAMALCGGRNIFADLTAPAPVVSIEAVLARAPAVIVAADDGPDIAAFWARFAALPAARQRAFVRVDAAALNRPTPRLLEGAAALCAALQSR